MFIIFIILLEFDIDKGNTISSTYPNNYNWDQFKEKNIADLCLPDGAHIHSEDWTYILLHAKSLNSNNTSVTPKKNTKDKRLSLTSNITNIETDSLFRLYSNQELNDDTPTEEWEVYYGISIFKNKADKTVKRGAVQKSILLISKQPYFSLYEPILKHCINYYFEHKPKNFLKVIYDTLKRATTSVTLFDKTFPLEYKSYNEDEFDSTSLIQLIQRFGVDTMYLWYTLILEQRILITGQPAHLVGQCCLSLPLLVAPLKGFTEYISPYVALSSTDLLQRKQYICGATNAVLENRTELYDLMASFSTGIVRKSKAKLSTYDKEFIMNVISGMHKGETWVRDQFYNFTKDFLDSVSSGNYRNQQHRLLGEPFKLSKLYEKYLSQTKQNLVKDKYKSPVELITRLKSEKNLTDNMKKQFLWEMLQCLVDLNAIDEVCEKDMFGYITMMLDSNSAQVRKYAVATLAQIAISIKGQISLVQQNLIPRVVLMLRDPMPNVASAAAYCLYKISSLYIGVISLVKYRVPKILMDIICSNEDNLVLKTSSVETLLQIYKLDPTCPVVGVDSIKHILKRTSDVTFRNLLCQLLDVWGVERIPIKIDDSIQARLMSLRTGSLEMRTSATSLLLSDVAQDETLLLQIIASGGIQIIVNNIKETSREDPLSRLSMAILCLICDTAMGRSVILGNNIIESILEETKLGEYPLHLYYAYRFLEICCQHENTTERLIELKGIPILVDAILKYSEKPKTLTLTLPCLGALKYILLLNPVMLDGLQEKLQPLKKLYDKIMESKASLSSSFLFDDKEFFSLFTTVVSMFTDLKNDESDGLFSATEDFLDKVIGKKARGRQLKKVFETVEEDLPMEEDITAIADSLLESLDDEKTPEVEPMDLKVDEILATLSERPSLVMTPRITPEIEEKQKDDEESKDDKWDDILNLTDSILAEAP